MKWQVYPRYRDSGVEWLGEIPEHWDVWKTTQAFQQMGSGTTPRSDDLNYYDGEIPWVTTSELRETMILNTKSKLTEQALKDYSSLHVYLPGTLLVAMYGATIGRMGILGIPATVNQACCAFAGPKSLDPKFTFYWLWMRRPILIALSKGGGQPNLSQDDLRNIRIPAPSLPEQRTIAAFLDRETERLDALIARKERQIELLQEKRATLISHAVTKGLDPNAPMKDSGVEWLGEIPAHWEVMSLKFTVLQKPDAIKTGPFGSQLLSSEMMDSEVKVYNQRNVIDQDLTQGDNYVSREKYEELRAFTVYPGDVLITTRGTIGRCVIVPDDADLGVLHPCLIRVQPDSRKLLARFLVLLIQDSFLVQTQLFLMSNATTIEVIYSGNLRDAIVPIPPVQEQHRIIAYPDREIHKIDSIIAKVQASIERLQEYRTALISAAVTGKIDVCQGGYDGL